jgi:hypothetical protein
MLAAVSREYRMLLLEEGEEKTREMVRKGMPERGGTGCSSSAGRGSV